ncbi:hypothetical protein tb265_14350 [Gemmatimonadetes bacterium T265]|nr:hypothetical protein tb265_14350 [Gemmatimonadetes bacterium T265]
MLTCVEGRSAGAQATREPAASEPALYEYPAGVESRWSSAENPTGAKGQGGRENSGGKGHPFETLPAFKSLVLADVQGAGTIRRVWITVNNRAPEMLRGVRIEMFWDGATTPAVSAPLGDFFGVGLGQMVPFESALFASPEGRSFESYVPMPFRTRARVVLTNDTGSDLQNVYYDVDYTRVAAQPPGALYFHAYWHRERPTRLGEDFRVLPRVTGRGRFLGMNVGVRPDPSYGMTWWGEGAVKMYLDGDRDAATLVGTGSEDYIGSGWGQGVYANRYQGSLIANDRERRWAFYRYHVPDPIYFARDCEVVLQQIGSASRAEVLRMQAAGVRLRPLTIDQGSRASFHSLNAAGAPVPLTNPGLPTQGGVTFYRADDVSAVAYFYLDRPENGLPPLVGTDARLAALH